MSENLPATISKAKARKLTDRIKEVAEEAWRLLIEAHDVRAWAVLGYDSFSAYAEAEFGFSEGHARRLLNVGEVVRELEAAAGVQLPPGTVSQRAASDVGPAVAKVAEKVAARVEDVAPTDRPAIVAEVVEGHRQEKSAARARAPQNPPPPGHPLAPSAPVTPSTAPAGTQPCRACHGLGYVQSPGARPVARSAEPAVSPRDCKHPVGRWLGTTCMDCEATVGKR